MLRFAVKDSACDKGNALVGAHELARTSFNGSGVHAVIGAACTDASASAADYLTKFQIPQLSPSSTGSALSDGVAYPFFARTPPSDAWQSSGTRKSRRGRSVLLSKRLRAGPDSV